MPFYFRKKKIGFLVAENRDVDLAHTFNSDTFSKNKETNAMHRAPTVAARTNFPEYSIYSIHLKTVERFCIMRIRRRIGLGLFFIGAAPKNTPRLRLAGALLMVPVSF